MRYIYFTRPTLKWWPFGLNVCKQTWIEMSSLLCLSITSKCLFRDENDSAVNLLTCLENLLTFFCRSTRKGSPPQPMVTKMLLDCLIMVRFSKTWVLWKAEKEIYQNQQSDFIYLGSKTAQMRGNVHYSHPGLLFP